MVTSTKKSILCALKLDASQKPTKIDTIMKKIKLAFKEKTERFRDGSYFHDKWASHSDWIEEKESKYKD